MGVSLASQRMYGMLFVHGIAFMVPFYMTFSRERLAIIVGCYAAAMLSITVGYHRMHSHHSFKPSLIVRLLVALFGASAFQGSIKWWVVRHRLHHRFPDSDNDPYNARRGLWYSHMGWIFQTAHYSKLKEIDDSDLTADKIVVFQNKYFNLLAIFMCFIFPAMIGAVFFNDALGGLMYGGFVKAVCLWHATFAVNSLSHWNGDQPYTLDSTARDNWWLSFLTNGEGNHNFHHAFPRDYRCGSYWAQYDPTKWTIYLLSLVNLATDLYRIDDESIEKDAIVVGEIVLKKRRQSVSWGIPDADLPKFTMHQVREQCSRKAMSLLVIDGYVIDVGGFYEDHPGGRDLLAELVGQDATTAFYDRAHNEGAHVTMRTLAVGKLID
ncbi:hypothetical protein SmJEL517_g00691 [Synchytrium microbalum]|uniref:Cytochrome b5 heme-binding domain-containing protein n=1 Tax=Synchytrium microbalum TaxID=1806994 RepID=A0A507CIR6_9FUNG|nr:uncharacterized protein SmJEL517_g00691 [Synchytrium microbalum]TPX37635.1 hypothetical protein SmJEL517_g00691 [Synchytrium microbalum]